MTTKNRKRLSNAQNALYHVKKKLYQFHSVLILKEKWVDGRKKAIIKGRKGVAYYVLFKRAFFKSYAKITGDPKGGVGETINISDWKTAVEEHGITELLYVYQNGSIYKADPFLIKQYATTHTNEADGKKQYLFPVRLLRRLV